MDAVPRRAGRGPKRGGAHPWGPPPAAAAAAQATAGPQAAGAGRDEQARGGGDRTYAVASPTQRTRAHVVLVRKAPGPRVWKDERGMARIYLAQVRDARSSSEKQSWHV